MWKLLKAKLFKQTGESIGETLVALLISSLSLLMLAGAISAAARVITVSNSKMRDYYKNDQALIELEVITGADKVKSDEATVVIQNNSSSTQSQSIPVKYYENTEFGNIEPIAYG